MWTEFAAAAVFPEKQLLKTCFQFEITRRTGKDGAADIVAQREVDRILRRRVMVHFRNHRGIRVIGKNTRVRNKLRKLPAGDIADIKRVGVRDYRIVPRNVSGNGIAKSQKFGDFTLRFPQERSAQGTARSR